MDEAPAASELADLRRRVESLEQSIANVYEGQGLQQKGLEGMHAALTSRIAFVADRSGSYGFETLLGLVLSAVAGGEPPPADPEVLADSPAYRSIVSNRRVLTALEWQIRRRLAHRDDAAVLRVARAAGDWSCMHHPGVLASAPIEAALRATGQRLLAGIPPWAPDATERRVLHVLTLAHPIGGHTRLAERWMRLDPASTHSVVLTDQGDLQPPSSLERATDGRVRRLEAGTPSERAVELARFAREFDVVVLHIHPYDEVAVAAFADGGQRAPTILVDHGDHLFWLGVGAADAVVSVRPSGAALVVGRRGIAADRDVVIPLPLDPVVRVRSREQARDELGLPRDACVLLTIAARHKYADVGSGSFTALVASVLDSEANAVLVAIGPDTRASDWAALAARFPGRVHANGPSTETVVAREAGDIYLDSFPFGSPTSLFEAALYGTPTVVMRPPGVGVLAVEDPDVELIDAVDGASWVDAVVRLSRDPALREREGRRIADGIRASHGDERIARLIADLLSVVRRGAASELAAIPEIVTTFDAALVSWQEASGLGRPLEDLLASHGLLPQLA